MVEKQILEDVAKQNKYAILLQGKISRKVVKQTVMTTVYGVTFIGAREQIEKQLKDRGDVPAEETWLAASYVAKKVLAAIGDLFKGAKEIQTWLNTSARLIAKSIPPERLDAVIAQSEDASRPKQSPKDTPANRLKDEQMTTVVWTTPMGLPIVQPYRKTKRKQVLTALQTVYISDPSAPTTVNATKQASAFPPNFIHSLDATHMMLTALDCRDQGITFASVHDSYWTHACSIDRMSEVIRDTFVALHSSDVLGKLAEEFRERYKGYRVPVLSLKNGRLIKQFGVRTNAAGLAKDLDELSGETVSLADHSQSSDAQSDVNAVVSAAAGEHDNTESVEREGHGDADVLKALQADPAKTRRPRVIPIEAKYVELGSVLPPLPKKGQFEVSTIKKSLYFFS